MQTDRELIAGVLARAPGAADLFVARFSRFVWAILIHDMRLRRDAAEDLSQDVFVRLWEDDYRRLRIWRGEGAFASYLGPIVRRLALDFLRGNPAVVTRSLDGGEEDRVLDPPDPDPGPEELAMVEEDRERLARAVERLGERDSELYRLRHEQDLEYREIAARMEMTVNAVGVALSRLLKRLRQSMEPEPPDRPSGAPHGAKGVRSTSPEPSGS